jgi:hypothetical protein
MDFAFTPNLEESEEISRTMRTVSYEEAKAGVLDRVIEPLEERAALTNWDTSFMEFVEDHKHSKLLFCRYSRGVGVILSLADHRGIWAMQRESIRGKGIVPEHIVTFLEDLARRKGLT